LTIERGSNLMSIGIDQLRPGDLVTIQRGDEIVAVVITEVGQESLRGIIRGDGEPEQIAFPPSEIVALYPGESGDEQNQPQPGESPPSRQISVTRRGKPVISERWIAQAAYYMWEKEGRPHGRDLDHWLHAESEIRRLTEASSIRPPAR
jgi:hypothetical protein